MSKKHKSTVSDFPTPGQLRELEQGLLKALSEEGLKLPEKGTLDFIFGYYEMAFYTRNNPK